MNIGILQQYKIERKGNIAQSFINNSIMEENVENTEDNVVENNENQDIEIDNNVDQKTTAKSGFAVGGVR